MGILVSMDEVGRKACFCAVWFYDSSNANPKLTTIKTIETTVMCCLIYLYQKYEQISKFYEPRVIKICHGKKNSAGTTWVNKSHKLLAKPKVTNLACADFSFVPFGHLSIPENLRNLQQDKISGKVKGNIHNLSQKANKIHQTQCKFHMSCNEKKFTVKYLN